MGRRPKAGLDYFPKDVDYYDDFKIMKLMDLYGPIGQTIYDAILCMVYRNGYYLEVPDRELLALKVRRMIGTHWVRTNNLVLQVIDCCADIGLFDKDLLKRDVITSAGVQRRYDEVTVRNKVQKEKYWLLGKNNQCQPLLSAPKNGNSEIPVTEKTISVTEKAVSASEKQQKESKLNNIYIFSNPELKAVFESYLSVRQQSQKTPLTIEQISGLRESLMDSGSTDEERIAACKKAINSGWKDIYPLTKTKEKKNAATSKQRNGFHNFEERSYDYDALEQKLTGSQKGRGE